jgi:thioredoxin-related protein
MKTTTLWLIAMIISGSTLLSEISYGQLNTYQFEQLDRIKKKEQRRMAVFIHTGLCKYCKTMQNTSFRNKKVELLLNQHFYFIDLNVEETGSNHFHGHTFHYRPTGNKAGVYKLAEQHDTSEVKYLFLPYTF